MAIVMIGGYKPPITDQLSPITMNTPIKIIPYTYKTIEDYILNTHHDVKIKHKQKFE